MRQEAPDAKKGAAQAPGVERETYESDRPIKASSEDRFGRWNFSQRVAQVIAKRRDSSSIVVGIHAPWGEGKTSALHMIIEELEKHDHVLVVRFNPWRFPDESQLLGSFFNILAETFDASLATTGEKIGDIARKYAGVLAPISLFGVDAAAMVKSAAEMRPVADLEKLKTRIEAILEQSGKRVVVIMDDIDRLDKEEVQAVFKLVKLSADFPHTAYVLAFDEEKVAAALAEKYGGIDAGRNFLEKIIQVSLPLPPASTEALRAITFEGMEAAMNLAEIELSEPQVQKCVLTFVQAFDSRLETPRLAKRFVNGLTFSLPLLKGEVNSVDMILIEGMRTFYPRLYASIRDNADAYLGTHFSRGRGGEETKEQAKAVINAALEGLSEHDKKAAKVAIQELFPRTGVSGMFSMGSYGGDWDTKWARDKRIAAQRYFHRYFSYGVPPNDVSDRKLDEFLREIPTRDVDYVVNEVRALAANGRAGVLIEKLRAREVTLTAEVAYPLASSIARCGEVFPLDRGMYGIFGASTFSQACILIRNLVKRIEVNSGREDLALKIANEATPLPFAVEYARWIRNLKRSAETEDEADSVISRECEQEINRRIVARITADAQEESLEKRYLKDANNLYQFWRWNDQEGVQKFLERRFQERPDEVVEFLHGSTREGWSLETEISFKMNLDRDNYNSIVGMVNPQVIMGALRQIYPGIDTSQPIDDAEVITKDLVALTFAQLHRQVMNETAANQEMAHSENGEAEQT